MSQLMQVLAAINGIIAAVQAVEKIIPGAGQGKEKLDAVIEIITGAEATLKDCGPQIAVVVGTIVKLFNAHGWQQPAA